MKFRFIILAIFLLFSSSFAQQSEQTFLTIKDTGVEDFIKTHPEYDGRGTIIFIFDTGLDNGVEGLLKTSAGEVKVIDVQDFTGQGDVSFFEADTDNEDGKTIFSNEEKNFSVKGKLSSMLASADDKYFIGAFPEMQLLNSGSGATDLNGNDSTDDVYYMVVYQTKENFWVVYFDLNGNGDLSDESPIRTYKENYDAFVIPNEKGLPPFTMGLNIFPEEQKVVFHFDDGSHGTHCGGIAAGYNIGDIGLNGVAPGAQVISLKLGNNNYTGGATVNESMKKAYLYADKISKERKEPCVINMSFGVGSEIEGNADMEKFLDELLKNNPYLYVCVSNGNNGPGISSTGLPSASSSVFASGAILTNEVGRDNYGTSFDENIILYFSSRGGEVSKPDITAPGAATSTVPNFVGRDRFWGTSMASPYSAGVMSLLLSAAQKEFPDVKIPARLLYKIVREGAVKMDGYDIIDYGAGYINITNSYELLKKYLKNNEHKNFETYTTSSFAPNQADGRAATLYIRDGSYLTGDEVFTYVVTRNNSIGSDKFYRSYNIKSDSGWLTPVQKKTYIRNDQTTMVNVKIDKQKLSEPGLYTSRITALRDDVSKTPEFEMMATIVIPYEFYSSNDYKMSWTNKKVVVGGVDRYFIKTPAGQTSLKISLSRDGKEYSRARYWLFDKDGISIHTSQQLYSVDNDKVVENYHYNLEPGVYEIDIDGLFLGTSTSTYSLSVEFFSIETKQNEIAASNGFLNTINLFNKSKEYKLSGEILGYEKKYELPVDGSSIKRYPFTMMKGETSREFNLELSKEDFNKITDFSFMILDENGKALKTNALGNRTGSVEIKNPQDKDSVNYILEIIPAFTHKEGTGTLYVQEITSFKSPVAVDIRDNNRKSTVLYPHIQKMLKCKFSKPESSIPVDAKAYGKIYFKSPSTDKTEYQLPINFKF